MLSYRSLLTKNFLHNMLRLLRRYLLVLHKQPAAGRVPADAASYAGTAAGPQPAGTAVAEVAAHFAAVQHAAAAVCHPLQFCSNNNTIV